MDEVRKEGDVVLVRVPAGNIKLRIDHVSQQGG